MLVFMTLRCEQCGHENDSRYRFCGMCGAKLPLSSRETAAPRTDPADSKPPAKPVSGPSFLGLADDPSDPVSYLLEEEPSTGRWGRYLVLAVFIAGTTVAGWYWRQDLRSLASRFSGGPPATPSQETTNLTPAPAAASSSETSASPSATPSVVPPRGTGASNQAGPAGALSTTQPEAPASNQAPTRIASTLDSVAASTPSPATESPQTQPAPPQAAAVPSDSSQPADSNSNDEASTQNSEVSRQETLTAKPRAAVKASKSSGEQAPPSSESDALETQGEKYLYGNGVAANCALAQKSLLAAAERSSTRAQSVLGTMYATGHCATRDLPLAYRWFARALRQDPSNTRIEQDLKVLWGQMSQDERQLALRTER